MPLKPVRSLAVLVTVLAAATITWVAPAGAVDPNRSVVPVTSTSIDFTDTTRSTPAHGVEPESPSRFLPTLLIHPTVPGRYPLLVFSHGNGGSGPAYELLLRQWASYGFV